MPHTQQVKFTVTAQELDVLRRDASALHLTLSAYLRSCLGLPDRNPGAPRGNQFAVKPTLPLRYCRNGIMFVRVPVSK